MNELGSDIVDIRGPILQPQPFWAGYEGLIVGLVALLALAALVFFARRFWTRRENAKARALRRIASARSAASQVGARITSVALTEAVRDYIEAHFGLHAPRKTSEELLRELAQSGWQQRDALERFMAACDRAKFGGYDYEADRLELLCDEAVRFVHSTWHDASDKNAAHEDGNGPSDSATSSKEFARADEPMPMANHATSTEERPTIGASP